MKKRILAVMIFIEIVIQGESTKGQSAKWTYNSNYDGDSVTVTREGEKREKVRLLWIDAPELKQPMGQASRNFLESILTKKQESKYCWRRKGSLRTITRGDIHK
jgi:endonuclease YncB( thermonuclease family)